jgi:FAD synthetase
LVGDLKVELKEFFDLNTQFKCCLIGNRESDMPGTIPFIVGQTKFFHWCDEGWPNIYRISPLLEWTNKDVWNYILGNKIEYCSLYDKGFSSIGTKKNTIPNPLLTKKDGISHPSILDDKQERYGRKVN